MSSRERFSKYLNFTVEVIIVFLILSIFADFIEKLDINYQFNAPKINKYLKLLFLVYSLLVVSTYRFKDKTVKNKLILIPACFFVVFIVKTLYISQIPALIRNFFLIGTVPFFYIIREQNLTKLRTYLLPTLKVIIGVNFLAILIGLIFDIQLFKTYNNNIRFGFNGLLLNQVQPNYFYTSLLFIFYKKSKLYLLISVFCGLVLGTKAFYVILFLFTLIVSFELFKNKHKKTSILIITSSAIIFVLLLYLLFSSNIFSNIISNKGIVTAFFSYRDVYLIEIINSINSENFNLFIGTISLDDYRSEFSFIDIILFLGILGFIFYTIVLKNIYKIFVNDKFGRNYFMLILLIACFSGNFFSFPFNCFMFMITLVYLFEDSSILKLET